jgi:uncharacterized SAM-binding protein YcdF (DUF218 family)
VGLALLSRRPRLGRALAWAGLITLLGLSLPVVSHALLRLVESAPALDPAKAGEAQAIVVLGGGLRRHAPEFGGETLGRLTLERVRYGARVARQTGLPLLVSGGALFGASTEAALMKRALEAEFNVAVRWMEERSRDTRSNAVESAAILRPAGVKRVLLVAHGFDMRRAAAEFASAGLEVVPAPTQIAGPKLEYGHPVELVPSMSALHGSYYALYELLGDVARRVRLAWDAG